MPVHIEVPALSLDEIRKVTSGELRWSELAGHVDDPDIPAIGGVYAWVSEETDAVIYIGKADGQTGLRQRLSNELNWVAKCAGDRPDERPQYWAGHPRAVLAMTARVCWAETSSPVEWERRLLQLSLHLTGLVPTINGGAWWSKGERADRDRAWAAEAAASL